MRVCVLSFLLVLLSFQALGQGPQNSQEEPEAQETVQLLKEDVLVFRVQTRQVFFENLKSYLSHLKDFKCLFPEPRLLSLAEVDLGRALSLREQSVGAVQKSPEVVKSLMRAILAQVYSNSLTLSLERDFDLSLPLQKCGLGRFGSWNNELKSLVQAELYLRQGDEKPSKIDAAARMLYYQNIDQKMDYEFYL